jgi:uncharacterized membrane protein YhdT
MIRLLLLTFQLVKLPYTAQYGWWTSSREWKYGPGEGTLYTCQMAMVPEGQYVGAVLLSPTQLGCSDLGQGIVSMTSDTLFIKWHYYCFLCFPRHSSSKMTAIWGFLLHLRYLIIWKTICFNISPLAALYNFPCHRNESKMLYYSVIILICICFAFVQKYQA